MQTEKWLIACAAAACAFITAAAAAAEPTPVTLAQVLAAARGNTDVTLAGQALAASRADVLAVDHAPLPVLGAKASSIDLQNGVGPGNVLTRKRIDKSVGLDWTWERGDKRALRTQAAQAAVAAARADVTDVRSQQLLAASSAFWDLLAAQEKLAQVKELASHTTRIADTAARRVKAGDLAAQDGLRTRIEAARAEADIQSAELDVQRAALALRQLTRLGQGAMNGAEGAPLQAEGAWPALAPSPVAATEASSTTLATLAETRPEVRAAQARVQAARAALDTAAAQKKTDVTWGASLDHYPGTSNRLVELRLQMPLQWGYSYQGEIARAQAGLEQAETLRDKIQLATQAELQRLALEMAAAAERARRYANDILPGALQAGRSAQLAYDKGALPLTDLLDAQRTLRATQLDAIAARADHARALGAWQLRTAPDANTDDATP